MLTDIDKENIVECIDIAIAQFTSVVGQLDNNGKAMQRATVKNLYALQDKVTKLKVEKEK